MKTIILFLSAFLLLTTPDSLRSQPVFTGANCFKVFDYGTIGVITVPQNFSTYIPLTGPSYTWNFFGGGIVGPWGNISVPTEPYDFRPGSYSPVFPLQGAQINEYAPMQFGRDVFYSYSPDEDTLYYNGHYSGGTVYAVYPPVPYLTFPLSYGDSVTTVNYVPAQGNAVAVIRRTHRYDGYGNIRLPYDTVTSVYRIRTTQIDSSLVPPPSATVTEEIIWFQAFTGIPVFRLVKSPSGFFAYYASAGLSSGLEQVDASGFTVYPVPFGDELNISIPAGFKLKNISVIDAGGRVVLNRDAEGLFHRLDAAGLAPGFYRLLLFSDRGQVMSKNIVRLNSH